jgi:Cyanate permease
MRVGVWLPLQALCIASANGALKPMLSHRAIGMGANAFEVGLIATIFALPPVAIAIAVGRRIDRQGPVRYLLVGNLIVLAGVVVALVGHSLTVLYLAAAAVGAGLLIAVLAQQAYTAQSPPQDRDRDFGRLTAGAALGHTIGPAALALAPAVSTWSGAAETSVGFTVGLVFVIAALVAVWPVRGAGTMPAPSRTPPSSGRVTGRIVSTGGMWQALLAGGISFAALDLLAAFLPLWAADRSIGVTTVGILLALRGVATLAARVASGRLIDRLGRRRLLVGALGASSGGLAALPLVGVVGAAVIMGILGAGLGLAQPLTMAWISGVTSPGARATALGVYQMTNRIAQATLPAGIAGLAAGAGSSGIFWGAAALVAGAGVLLLRSPID